MNVLFKYAEWNNRPRAVEKLGNGCVRVARNVEQSERADDNGNIVAYWHGEVATMSEAAYAAYEGAMEAEKKREAEIVDETILALIEEGSL